MTLKRIFGAGVYGVYCTQMQKALLLEIFHVTHFYIDSRQHPQSLKSAVFVTLYHIKTSVL